MKRKNELVESLAYLRRFGHIVAVSVLLMDGDAWSFSGDIATASGKCFPISTCGTLDDIYEYVLLSIEGGK